VDVVVVFGKVIHRCSFVLVFIGGGHLMFASPLR
jgi:hypothetical protein